MPPGLAPWSAQGRPRRMFSSHVGAWLHLWAPACGPHRGGAGSAPGRQDEEGPGRVPCRPSLQRRPGGPPAHPRTALPPDAPQSTALPKGQAALGQGALEGGSPQVEGADGPSAKHTRSYNQQPGGLPMARKSQTVLDGGCSSTSPQEAPGRGPQPGLTLGAGPPGPRGAGANPETFMISTPQMQKWVRLQPQRPWQLWPPWPAAQKGEFMPSLVSNCSFCRFW